MLIMVPREIYTTGDSTQLNINFPLNHIAIDVDMTIVEDFLFNFFFIGNNLFIIFMAAQFHILQYLYLNHISQCKISVYFAKKKGKKKKPKIFFFFLHTHFYKTLISVCQCAYMHDYCSTFIYKHNFANIDVGVFWLKCIKLTTFCILHNFALTNAVVLCILSPKRVVKL